MNSLIGIWFYVSLIYQGQPLDRPNQALKMYYTFQSSTLNEIMYFREGEQGACKRIAEYKIVDSEIQQTVIAVDPANADFCSLDTDMQLGNFSKTRFDVSGNKFHLHLPLGEETLTYVWEKVND